MTIKNECLIQSLNKFANALALIPPSEIKDSFTLTGYKLYSAIVLLTILFGSVFSLYHRFTIGYSQSQYYVETMICIDTVSTAVLTTLTCTAILRSAFKNTERYQLIPKLFTTIDRELGWCGINGKNNKILYIFFGGIQLCKLLLVICDILFTLAINQPLLFAYYAVDEIMQYYWLIIVALICNYVITLKARLSFANSSLSAVLQIIKLKDTYQNEAVTNVRKPVVETWREVYKMRKIFNTTSKLIKTFNAVFGWEILITVIYVTVEMLHAVNFVIMAYLDDKRSYKEQQEQYVIWYAALWCFMTVVMGVVVAVTCDMTTKEAQRTATVCYNLLLDVPVFSNNIQDRILREELILLAQQATHQCPYFSAAGFFKVDYTMLFGLLGTVTSYVIVLIQINK